MGLIIWAIQQSLGLLHLNKGALGEIVRDVGEIGYARDPRQFVEPVVDEIREGNYL